MSEEMCLSFKTSAVNLLVGWKLFAVSRNASNVSLQCIQFMSMSSINLSPESGFGVTGCSSCFSSLSMNILAYDGAIFVPMAIH